MSEEEQRPAPLRDVSLNCPQCGQTIKLLAELPFIKQPDGYWHAQDTASCMSCVKKVDLHLRVDEEGQIYAPVPGATEEPEWNLFGYMDLKTGAIAVFD